MLDQILKPKMTVRFTKGDFTSPSIGNVYVGKIATLRTSTAKAFIASGVAVEHVEGETVEDPKETEDDGKKKADADSSGEDKYAGEPSIKSGEPIKGHTVTGYNPETKVATVAEPVEKLNSKKDKKNKKR